MKFLFDNGNQHVGRHGAPNLRLDGVLAVAQEPLDAQVLLDPFEEQFDLPTVFVKGGYLQWRQYKVVGQKHERLARFGVFEPYAPQVLWVMSCGIKTFEQDGLVANNACHSIGSFGVNASRIHVGLCRRHKEASRTMHGVKSSEIQVTSIHDVESTRLDRHEIQHVDFVQFAVADVYKRWNSATQVKQRVQFDGTFGFAKRRPVEQAQAQIDRCGVQRVDRVLQVQADQIGIAVKLARSTNQQSSHVAPNAPIARFVGIGECRSMNAVTQTHGIKFARIGTKGHLDILQALAPSQLSKRHHSKLFRTGHATNTCVAAIAVHYSCKTGPRDEFHQLGKKCLSNIHDLTPRSSLLGKYSKMKDLNSNRHQIKSAARPYPY